MRIEEKIT